MKTVTRGIRVWVVLEFDGVDDPDSPEADEITQTITDATDWLSDEFKASRAYVTDVNKTLWVEGESK